MYQTVQTPVRYVAELIDACRKALQTVLVVNGVRDFSPVWMKKTFWTLAVIFRLKCRLVLWIN